MLIIERIHHEKFTASQQAVIDHILQNPSDLEEMTLRELAAACFTSNTTLIRIAHKLGYDGWDSFKNDFLKEQAYLNSHFSSVDPNIPFTEKDSVSSILHKVAELKVQAIRETENLQNPKNFRTAIDLLVKAERIYIVGQNNLHLLGDEFALKMGRIQKLAFSSDVNTELYYQGLCFQKGSVLIILSYSGETSEPIRLLHTARQVHIPIIAITSISESTLSKSADVVLPICTREKIYSKIGWYTTEASFSYILDCLYSGVFWENYQKNISYKLRTATRIEKGRKASSGIMSESEAKSRD